MNTNIFFISTGFYVTKSTDCYNQCSYRYQGLNNRIKLVLRESLDSNLSFYALSTPAVSNCDGELNNLILFKNFVTVVTYYHDFVESINARDVGSVVVS